MSRPRAIANESVPADLLQSAQNESLIREHFMGKAQVFVVVPGSFGQVDFIRGWLGHYRRSI